MRTTTKLEIKARAFEIDTGLMAPFKDFPAAAGPTAMVERSDRWRSWNEKNASVIRAMFRAFEEYVGE